MTKYFANGDFKDHKFYTLNDLSKEKIFDKICNNRFLLKNNFILKKNLVIGEEEVLEIAKSISFSVDEKTSIQNNGAIVYGLNSKVELKNVTSKVKDFFIMNMTEISLNDLYKMNILEKVDNVYILPKKSKFSLNKNLIIKESEELVLGNFSEITLNKCTKIENNGTIKLYNNTTILMDKHSFLINNNQILTEIIFAIEPTGKNKNMNLCSTKHKLCLKSDNNFESIEELKNPKKVAIMMPDKKKSLSREKELKKENENLKLKILNLKKKLKIDKSHLEESKKDKNKEIEKFNQQKKLLELIEISAGSLIIGFVLLKFL